MPRKSTTMTTARLSAAAPKLRTYAQAKAVESSTIGRIAAWAEDNLLADDEMLVNTNGEREVHRHLQKTCGDFLVVGPGETGRLRVRCAVEVKSERKFTGNLFIENFSDFRLDRRNEGWLFSLKTDELWYYFKDAGVVLRLDFQALRRWLIDAPNPARRQFTARIWTYRVLAQQAYEQANNTHGVLVPIADLPATVLLEQRCIDTEANAVWRAAQEEKAAAAAAVLAQAEVVDTETGEVLPARPVRGATARKPKVKAKAKTTRKRTTKVRASAKPGAKTAAKPRKTTVRAKAARRPAGAPRATGSATGTRRSPAASQHS